MEGYKWGRGITLEKVQGLGSIIHRCKIDKGMLRTVGNGETKELTCTTYGHELRGAGILERRGALEKGSNGKNGTTIIA